MTDKTECGNFKRCECSHCGRVSFRVAYGAGNKRFTCTECARKVVQAYLAKKREEKYR